ncbi:MAG: Eco57I restriction-modification methylase domain-containing protein [Armatimonadetes bacterium]|nr:Eco57I restriction-modification methylase domain-containing protein [Armatimonadota bacterium]
MRQHLIPSEHLPSADECTELYNSVRAIWVENFSGLRRRAEAYTRSKFLDPVLRELGWFFIPEESLPYGRTRKRPDYCLFLDEATEQRAAGHDAVDIFRASATVLEAKKCQHPLDDISRTDTPGWFPSEQIQDYLRWAKDDTGRFFNWAILTNGNEWRLYCEQAAPNAYFAFHLADGQDFCPLNEFRLFIALFSPRAFAEIQPQRCFLDDCRDESLVQQTALEHNLRKRVFIVIEELAEGFFHNPDNGLTEANLDAVYHTTLIFLYRLLFILYAESRGLLPAKPYGAQSNKRYREEFSISRLVPNLADRTSFDDDAFDTLYESLLRLFHLINGTNQRQNEILHVTRYNGGLFDPSKHEMIEQWRVGDKTLANILRQLIFVQPPARPRQQQQVIATKETVDFGTLEVRQLGDIYEGLLGGRLMLRDTGRLELVDENGENHQHGVFYTPDWVVRFLVKETLQPLIDEIDFSTPVQAALNAKSIERKQDDSFALAVLGLSIVDPAMGSEHFLVRATEWLAEQIVYHPTTKLKTEKIVASGKSRKSREDILLAGRVPVPPGVSHEQAELAYWRRRIVESSIYGVDINPLAVELAKLSLWLTCIAVDEPLNFLDHHLRVGNSLISAAPQEAHRVPNPANDDERQTTVDVGDALVETLREVIQANVDIAQEASTEMEIVKGKEERWKLVQSKLGKFRDILNIWTAALDDIRINGERLNAFDYRLLVLTMLDPAGLLPDQRARGEKTRTAINQVLADRLSCLSPFHWRIEFPAVFYEADGSSKPHSRCGFDAVLGNPPYISTHTSSEQMWRNVLSRRAGYLEDLYVHFTDLGFRLLRPGGMFGFIVSDTFFTLSSKSQMRQWLQRQRLLYLGQCDPFNATVDAAIFVAKKEPAQDDERLFFIQARYSTPEGSPESDLPLLDAASVQMDEVSPEFRVQHGTHGCLRLHKAPLDLYRGAVKNAFFEPRPSVLKLYSRFNEQIKQLEAEWWDRIETSQKFADNTDAIRAYQSNLKPGNITIVGLIAEGGQGMRTANNGRFLGYLAGTHRAQEIERKGANWSRAWLAHPEVGPVFRGLLMANGGDPEQPCACGAAWEACVEPLKARFDARRVLGFSKSDLYRIVPPELIATQEDFAYAWTRRKAELFARWKNEPALNGFWSQVVSESVQDRQAIRAAQDITDADFCTLCQDLQAWVKTETPSRRKAAKDAIGPRSSENYTDPADAPRIAIVYNGLSGRGQWLPFRKGDPEGNRWTDNEPLYILWSRSNVSWLFENSGRSAPNMPVIRNAHLYLTPGVTYTLLGNHVALKAKIQDPCVFDAGASRLTPVLPLVSPYCLLAIFNSNVFRRLGA